MPDVIWRGKLPELREQGMQLAPQLHAPLLVRLQHRANLLDNLTFALKQCIDQFLGDLLLALNSFHVAPNSSYDDTREQPLAACDSSAILAQTLHQLGEECVEGSVSPVRDSRT